MPKFIVKHPDGGEQTFAIKGARITVGRRADNDVQINHATISGYHAEIVVMHDHYLLRDLDSTNHCYVDGIQVAEADLSEKCKIYVGRIECEFVPDAPLAVLATQPVTLPQPAAAGASPEETSLRKTIGMLRQQNEALADRVADQQKQINILGRARLVTPTAGADLEALRERVKTLSDERDRLARENHEQRLEIERLRKFESADIKATVPVTLPPPVEPRVVRVGPGGAATAVAVAPLAKVVSAEPFADWSRELTAWCAAAEPMLRQLHTNPDAPEGRAQFLAHASRLVESAGALGGHPASRFVSALEALLRDAAQRSGPLAESLLRTISEAHALLAALGAPDALAKAKELSAPQVLAVDDDQERLPAMLAALDSSALKMTSCGDATQALGFLEQRAFDVVLLDMGLAGSEGMETCTRLRSLPHGAQVPVVFLAGEDGLATRQRGLESGQSDFVGNPHDLFELTVKTHTLALRHQLGLR